MINDEPAAMTTPFPLPRSLALAVALSLPLLAAAQSSYQLTDLGSLPETSDCGAAGLNSRGDVVGQCVSSKEVPGRFSSTTAFVYSNGAMSALAPLPGEDSSYASAISDNGTIIGLSMLTPALNGSGPRSSHFVVYRNGQAEIPSGLPSAGLVLNDISGSGEILGSYTDSSNRMTRFLYSDAGLRILPFGMGAISRRGMVVGQGEEGDGRQLIRYDAGKVSTLAMPAGATAYHPDVINDQGQIAGSAGISYGAHINGAPAQYGSWGISRAYLYSAGKVSYLGFLAGYNQTYPQGINQQGVLVGTASYSGPLPRECITAKGLTMNLIEMATRCRPTLSKPNRAFIYSNQGLVDLNRLLSPEQAAQYVLTGAAAINDAGQIAATATVNGQSRAVLLTPLAGPAVAAAPATATLLTFEGRLAAPGSDGSQRLSFLPGPVAGQSGQVFVVAMQPTEQGGQVFFMDSRGDWQLFRDCASAAAYSPVGPLTTLNDMPLLSVASLNLLGGSAVTLFVGYGLAQASDAAGTACQDMMLGQTYLPLLTL